MLPALLDLPSGRLQASRLGPEEAAQHAPNRPAHGLARRLGHSGRSFGVGVLLALLTISFAIALGRPLQIAPMVIVAATGSAVALHLWRNEARLTPALPATAVVLAGVVGPGGYVGVALIAGLVAMAAARLPHVVRIAQHRRVTDVVKTATGVGLCMTTSGWAIGATTRRLPDVVSSVAQGHVHWTALLTAVVGLGVATLARNSKLASLGGGAAAATAIGLIVNAPAIGSVSSSTGATTSDSVTTSPAVVILAGLLMGAVVISEAATSAQVAQKRTSDRTIFLAGISTVLASPGGTPAIAPAPARTHVAAELQADTSAVGTHLALLVAVVASPAVAGLVGALPLAAMAVPVALSGLALIQRNAAGLVTVGATLVLGVAGGLLMGLVLSGLMLLATRRGAPRFRRCALSTPADRRPALDTGTYAQPSEPQYALLQPPAMPGQQKSLSKPNESVTEALRFGLASPPSGFSTNPSGRYLPGPAQRIDALDGDNESSVGSRN